MYADNSTLDIGLWVAEITSCEGVSFNSYTLLHAQVFHESPFEVGCVPLPGPKTGSG